MSTVDAPTTPPPAGPASATGTTARMPRAQRRVQLRDAARAEFVELGYAHAGMDRIAERAGVSKPVLYQHFSGKRDLFLDLMDEEVAAFVDRLTEALTTATDHRRRVSAAVTVVFDYVDSPDRSHRLIFDSGAEDDPDVQARVEAVQVAVSGEVARVMREETHLSAAEAEILSRGVVAYVFGAARHWADRLDPATRPDASAAAAVVDEVLWSGLDIVPS